MYKRLFTLVVGAGLISGYCNASVIVFSDLTESVSVTIDGTNVRSSARATNVVFTGESVDFDLSLANGDFITTAGYTNLLDPPGSEDRTGTVSDRFVYSFTNGQLTYHVSIGSDPNLPAIPAGATDFTTVMAQGLPANPYYEDGTQQKVATAFLGGNVQDTFLSSQTRVFQSPAQ